MTNVILAPFLYGDFAVVAASASGIGGATATRGDWGLYSALWAIPATPATIGSPAYKVSAAGVFMEHNPTFDDNAVAINNSGITMLRAGVLRVSAGNSGSALTIPMGSVAYPNTTSSGIVGQTGATGVGPQWLTAPTQQISGNPTGAIASGVAVVINHPIGGDSGLGQLDVVFNLPTPDYW